MQKSPLEPGFLQVFRIYAWLRLATLLLISMAGVRFYFSSIGPFHTEVSQLPDLRLPMILMVMNVVVLLGCLYWQRLVWDQPRAQSSIFAPLLLGH